MNTSSKKFGLGRGLEALLGDEDLDFGTDNEKIDIDNLVNNTVFKGDDSNLVDINDVFPCDFQPRTEFNEEALQSLSLSIEEKGILQPLLVRRKNKGFEIIAGERRWRAANKAGLTKVPVIIKDLSDSETLEIALIENLQRENLSAIEEAEGLNRLIAEHSYTQDVIGKIIGKSRSYIANTLRMLLLPEEIKIYVKENKLSAGHARALIGCKDAIELADKIISKGLSVRETEELAAKSKENRVTEKRVKVVDVDLQKIMKDLEERLKLKVKINASKKGKGSVTLQYNNPTELSAIIDLLEQR